MTKLMLLSWTVFCAGSMACAMPEADSAPVWVESQPEVLLNHVVDASLLPAVEVAADRWIAATCLDIRVDGGGVEWALVEGLSTIEDGEVDGLVDDIHNPTWAHVNSKVKDQGFVAAHEMGHRLGSDHAETAELMSVRRTLNRQTGIRYNHIGENSLSQVCSTQDCKCFNPEKPEYDPTL